MATKTLKSRLSKKDGNKPMDSTEEKKGSFDMDNFSLEAFKKFQKKRTPPPDMKNDWEKEFDEKFPWYPYKIGNGFNKITIDQRNPIKSFIRSTLRSHDRKLAEKIDKLRTPQHDRLITNILFMVKGEK